MREMVCFYGEEEREMCDDIEGEEGIKYRTWSNEILSGG